VPFTTNFTSSCHNSPEILISYTQNRLSLSHFKIIIFLPHLKIFSKFFSPPGYNDPKQFWINRAEALEMDKGSRE